MNYSPEQRIGVAALRPWPFGPPLRGRALRCATDTLACHGLIVCLRSQPDGGFPMRLALAPVGGLACPHSIYVAER